MTDESLIDEICFKYKKYVASNHNEKYIDKLLVQEGYKREDVNAALQIIYKEKNTEFRKKKKFKKIISIFLYVLGIIIFCLAIVVVSLGIIKGGIALAIVAILIWIRANK